MTPSKAFKIQPVEFISNILIIIGSLNWLTISILDTDYIRLLTGINSKYNFL